MNKGLSVSDWETNYNVLAEQYIETERELRFVKWHTARALNGDKASSRLMDHYLNNDYSWEEKQLWIKEWAETYPVE